jgi:hypothetical protein
MPLLEYSSWTDSCCYAGHGIRIENVGRGALQATLKVSFMTAAGQLERSYIANVSEV